jgi:hypothetical protein
MKPHCMSIGSRCFRMADAAQQGVGKSLHAHPPRSRSAWKHSTRRCSAWEASCSSPRYPSGLGFAVYL